MILAYSHADYDITFRVSGCEKTPDIKNTNNADAEGDSTVSPRQARSVSVFWVREGKGEHTQTPMTGAVYGVSKLVVLIRCHLHRDRRRRET